METPQDHTSSGLKHRKELLITLIVEVGLVVTGVWLQSLLGRVLISLALFGLLYIVVLYKIANGETSTYLVAPSLGNKYWRVAAYMTLCAVIVKATVFPAYNPFAQSAPRADLTGRVANPEEGILIAGQGITNDDGKRLEVIFDDLPFRKVGAVPDTSRGDRYWIFRFEDQDSFVPKDFKTEEKHTIEVRYETITLLPPTSVYFARDFTLPDPPEYAEAVKAESIEDEADRNETNIEGPSFGKNVFSIKLRKGWNWIAYPFDVPLSPDRVFSSINDDIMLVKNEDGQVYYPIEGINGINIIKPGVGYKIYVARDTRFTFRLGDGVGYLGTDHVLTLGEGWNLVGYWLQEPLPPEEAFASVRSKIRLVRDADGAIYDPEGDVGSIKRMKPGGAYAIYAAEPTQLSYPAK